MLKERSQSFKVFFVLADFLMVGLSFASAYFTRFNLLPDSEFQRIVIDPNSYLILGIVLSFSQVISFLGINLYHPRRAQSYIDEFFSIVFGILLNLLVVLSLLFFFRGESFSRLVVTLFALYNLFFVGIGHSIVRSILRRLRRKGYNLRSVLVLGTGKSAVIFANSLKKHSIYGYRILGFIKGKEQIETDIPVLGTISDLEKLLENLEPDLIIYAMGQTEGNHLKKTIRLSDFYGIDTKVIPSYEEFLTANGRVEVIDGLPVISIRNIPLQLGYNRILKRTFDLVFSLGFILLFSPIFIGISILIKLSSQGPILYRQERVGLDNRIFWMLKFRTMKVQEKKDSDTLWTKKDDPRVTSIGKVLRKFSLDELPQFWNVVKGDMSIVGPRPERPYYVEKFRMEFEKYMRRHASKAGITGWAQINGWRGDTSIEERVEADIYYIENWSLFFDLKIILLTPVRAILDRNAY